MKEEIQLVVRGIAEATKEKRLVKTLQLNVPIWFLFAIALVILPWLVLSWELSKEIKSGFAG